MPNVSQKNGIDMGNIASINDQTVSAGGGAYDPINETGTYTETVPTSGLIKRGGVELGQNYSSDGYAIADSTIGFPVGTDTVVNIGSDVDGIFNIVGEDLPAGMGDVSIVSAGRFVAWVIDSAGKLWRVGSSLYGGNAANAGTLCDLREWRQVTGVGDSDTGWTDVNVASTTSLLINSGKLYAIGANQYGVFGNGTTTATYSAFTQIGTDTDWTKVTLTTYNSFAIKGASNVLYSAGRNTNGMCGNGTTSGNQTTWTALTATNMVSATNNNFTFVVGCRESAVAIQSGRAFFWGDPGGSFEAFGGNFTADQTIAVQSGSVGGTLQTDWVSGCVEDRCSHLINSSGELYHAGFGGYYNALNGSTTDHVAGDHVQTGTDTDWQEVKAQRDYTFMAGAIARKGNTIYYSGIRNYGHFVDTTGYYISSPTSISNSVTSGTAWDVSSTAGNANTVYIISYT